MKNSAKTLLFASLLAAAYGVPAHAASSASASLSDFRYTVVDLNTFDGIASSLTFISPLATTNAFASTAADHSGASSLSSASATSASSAAAAQSSLTALTASGSSIGNGGNYYAWADTATSQIFTLTPWTQVTFFLTAHTSAARTSFAEDASAYVEFSVSGTGPSEGGVQDSKNSMLSTLTPYWDGVKLVWAPVSKDGTLGISFLNLSSSTIEGKLNASVTVSGFSNVAAVPEPESYAMLLAGLGLLGLAGRRKSNSPA